MRIVTSSEMKQIERNSLDFGLSFHRLMENAGSAAAAFIRRTFKMSGRNCVVFCSKGNNGGDGFVVARKLSESGARVIVILLDGKPVSDEALAMYEQLDGLDVPVYDIDQAQEKIPLWLDQTDLVVDAICGTGFHGELREAHRQACQAINECTAVIVSLDIPTGVECDSGEVADGALRADYTLAFDSLKPCHLLPDCLGFCGAVEVLDIGIPDEARVLVEPCFTSLDAGQVFELIPPRQPDAHKGTFGRVLIVAGSARYRGAAILSTTASLRCGAGLVTLASTEAVCASAAVRIPEAIFLPLPASNTGTIDPCAPCLRTITDTLKSADAVAFGCGLENSAHTTQLLAHILKTASCPILLDADGINALSGNIHLLKEATAPVILTPHPGEMARLCGVETAQIQANRIGFALSFARSHGVYLLLKGPGTIIACPDGRLLRNETGNAGLAKAGSGDVLTGMIAALLAGGLSPRDSAACGAFLHGMAADRTALRRSQTAMLPSELLEDLAGIFLAYGR